MTVIRIQSGVSCIYDSNVNLTDLSVINLNAVGSTYTYRAYGTAGQTVEIRGGFVGDAWADMQQIAVLTVGGTQSAVVQHTWPVLAVQGAARVKIARGNA